MGSKKPEKPLELSSSQKVIASSLSTLFLMVASNEWENLTVTGLLQQLDQIFDGLEGVSELRKVVIRNRVHEIIVALRNV